MWQQDLDIHGRLVRPDQSFVGPEFLIASSFGGVLKDPAVSFDPSSNQFLVAWSDSYGWDDIYARLVGANGEMPEPAFALASGRGDFENPDMAFDSTASQFLAVWRHQTCLDENCDDDEVDIYGAFYKPIVQYEVSLPIALNDYASFEPTQGFK